MLSNSETLRRQSCSQHTKIFGLLLLLDHEKLEPRNQDTERERERFVSFTASHARQGCRKYMLKHSYRSAVRNNWNDRKQTRFKQKARSAVPSIEMDLQKNKSSLHMRAHFCTRYSREALSTKKRDQEREWRNKELLPICPVRKSSETKRKPCSSFVC